ncbi:leucine--tRNA ligase [Candidatus Woesearchaeota archaeon CG10_big_fil_rev_8_21_14_0_10_36_11]|nr:MAG: leucine--tRNA ligase [Candidatus Woesearchaeota archaeon CG10_big_fil_rev_8_21_14_0_10_36_11]
MTINWEIIQEKWQKRWEKEGIGKAVPNKNKEKFFMIFAYPGVSGFLHVGHMRGFSYTDAICRYERLQGKEVLYPVGTHASGNQAIAFAHKVKNNDMEWISYLTKNGCSTETIKTLTKPENVIKYFNDIYVNEYWKKFGFLCDWERFLCSTHKDYEKFIQWQFKKLQQKDLLIQKPYFATACIKCGPVAVDPSETDISQGGNAEKNEYTLLKFKLDEDYLVAATLRPETIYGQTNLWINPNAQYVRVEVEGENWIMSRDAAEKLSYQKDDVILKEDVDPIKLIGKKCIAPGIDMEIVILPSPLCNPKIGSGLVTSVPSNSIFDYVGLQDLEKDTKTLQKYNLTMDDIRSIQLIPIIKTKGYGNVPTKEIVEKLKIHSLQDTRLFDANKDLYKVDHHTGIMLETCGKYSGKKVEDAKELMKAELLETGKADILYDLSEEVICRCGGKVVIKRIDNQWFIKYSDPELTERSKEQVKEMKIYPQEYAEHLPGIIDWFADRACARLGNWLGSTFPFDEEWTIEPISDSTLYPAYYIVSKFVNNKTITIHDLTEEFFDYVFLGEGEGKDIWKQIKEEFDYFYPLNINLGGKEHKTVHFPVFLMNHVAILPEEKWPKGIFVNWWVTGKGSKISKSKGGAVPIPEAVTKYGVDAMRLYYAHIGSPHTDVVWTEDIVMNYKNALERIYSVVEELKTKNGSKKIIDTWLLSRMNQHLKEMKDVMKTYDLRELASKVYFTMYDDLRWYVRRGGENKKIITHVLDIWCTIMNPITPHISEELNPSKSLVSSSSWPTYDETTIHRASHAGEELVRNVMDGMRNIIKLAKVDTPQKCTLFIAEPWLYNMFTILSHEISVTRNVGEIIKCILEEERMKMKGKEISKIVGSVLKDVSKLPSMVTSQEEECAVMNDAKKFLEKEFGCPIDIVLANESQHEKAKSAMPGKVGIVIE